MRESKPYPTISEEDGSCMTAQEPTAAAYASELSQTGTHPHIPGLPHTWDELVENLMECEEEIERGEYVEWENAVQQMRRYRRYGS